MRSGIGVLLLLWLVSSGTATGGWARHQHQHASGDPQALGAVTFENTCAPDVQDRFGRAVAMLHSFWYEAVEREFQAIAAADPTCAMAWWGVSMAQWQPLWEVRGPNRDALLEGREAIEKARAVAGAPPRERAYIEALARFYSGFDTIDHVERVLAYEQAMEALHAAYPQDAEAAVFHALALLGSAASLPPDKTYGRQKKAAAILQPLFRAQPAHPGVAHYIIHALDYPALAGGALDAARRYATIAPDSPHALHMPSHIFTRLGLWEESIASNRQVIESARKHGITGEELHGRDYLVFAHLQRGEDRLAREVMRGMPSIADLSKEAMLHFAGLYATAAMPARYAVERRQWSEAARLPDPAGFPGGRYAWAEGSIYFARALGAARTGRVAQARRDVAALERLRRTLLSHDEDYWARQIEIQRQAAAAWLAFAEGRRHEALEQMREAATLEDSTDKHPVTPGQIVPAHGLVAQMLLELDRPAEARAEFMKVLQAEPNRFGALYGAARAAELAGETEQARQLYQTLVTSAPASDRDELRHAREVLSGSGTPGR